MKHNTHICVRNKQMFLNYLDEQYGVMARNLLNRKKYKAAKEAFEMGRHLKKQVEDMSDDFEFEVCT